MCKQAHCADVKFQMFGLSCMGQHSVTTLKIQINYIILLLVLCNAKWDYFQNYLFK